MKTKHKPTPEDIRARKYKGARVRELRERLRPDLTLTQYAMQFPFSMSTEQIRLYENGTTPISDVVESQMYRILGCEVPDFLTPLGTPTQREIREEGERALVRIQAECAEMERELQARTEKRELELQAEQEERQRKSREEAEERERERQRKIEEHDRRFNARMARPVPESVRKVMEGGNGALAGLAAMILMARGFRKGTAIVEEWAQQAPPQFADIIRQMAKDVGVGEPDEEDEEEDLRL